MPSITGAWQVAGRAYIGFDEMTSLDTDYVRGISFWTDASSLLRTFGAIFSGRGAY